jgi:hypothetical protein
LCFWKAPSSMPVDLADLTPLLRALDIIVCRLLTSSSLFAGGLIATWDVLSGDVLLVICVFGCLWYTVWLRNTSCWGIWVTVIIDSFLNFSSVVRTGASWNYLLPALELSSWSYDITSTSLLAELADCGYLPAVALRGLYDGVL